MNIPNDLPPAISQIMTRFVSKLNIEIVTNRAINDYGVTQTFIVSLHILDAKCQLCGGVAMFTSTNEQVVPKNKHCHKWIKQLINIASSEGPNIQTAMKATEDQAITFLGKC